eukprot:1811630-Ditylum_brightwellii.AAC.1
MHISAMHDVQVGKQKDTEGEEMILILMQILCLILCPCSRGKGRNQHKKEEGGRMEGKNKTGQKECHSSKRICKESKGQVAKEGNKKVVYSDGISRPSYINVGSPNAKFQPVVDVADPAKKNNANQKGGRNNGR